MFFQTMQLLLRRALSFQQVVELWLLAYRFQPLAMSSTTVAQLVAQKLQALLDAVLIRQYFSVSQFGVVRNCGAAMSAHKELRNLAHRGTVKILLNSI